MIEDLRPEDHHRAIGTTRDRRMVGWRILLAAAGLACVLASGPFANAGLVACRLLLGFLCRTDKFFHPFDLVLGWMVLILGWCLIAAALGKYPAAPASAGERVRQAARNLRWLPIPIVATLVFTVAFAYWPRAITVLVVDIANVPRDGELRIGARGELHRTRASVYRRGFDHLLGLPVTSRQEFPVTLVESAQAHSEFPLASPRLSFERWRRAWTSLGVTVKLPNESIYVAVDLLPCEGCGDAAIEVGERTADRCTGYVGERIRCYGQTARYPKGAGEVRVVLDLKGLSAAR